MSIRVTFVVKDSDVTDWNHWLAVPRVGEYVAAFGVSGVGGRVLDVRWNWRGEPTVVLDGHKEPS